MTWFPPPNIVFVIQVIECSHKFTSFPCWYYSIGPQVFCSADGHGLFPLWVLSTSDTAGHIFVHTDQSIHVHGQKFPLIAIPRSRALPPRPCNYFSFLHTASGFPKRWYQYAPALAACVVSLIHLLCSCVSFDHCTAEKERKVKSLSRVRLFATPWTVAYEAPPSMGFSRQRYWSGLPFPSPGGLPTQGLNSGLPHCRQMLYSLSHQGSTAESFALILKVWIRCLCAPLAPVLTSWPHESDPMAYAWQMWKDAAQIPSCWPLGPPAPLVLRPHVPQTAPSQGLSTVRVPFQAQFYYPQDSSDGWRGLKDFPVSWHVLSWNCTAAQRSLSPPPLPHLAQMYCNAIWKLSHLLWFPPS